MEFIATEGEMSNFTSTLDNLSKNLRLRMSCRIVLLGMILTCSTGCSIFHPVRGVPASYLPDQFEGLRRGGKRTINPSLLVQTPPDQHRIAAGDVLSIYIPGVLGRLDADTRQFGVEPPINQPYSQADPPTIGYPITVRDDQTIALPQVPPINVYNKTLHEAELAIRKAYTEDFEILRPDEAMILVSLQRPRVHRVLVVRQETGNELASGGGAGTLNIGVSKRGTARVVTLKAYENDVLHALSMEDGVDGLPGLDAENTIYIIRRRPTGGNHPSYQPQRQEQFQPDGLPIHQRLTSQNRPQRNGIQLASAEEVQSQSLHSQHSVVTADYRSASSGGHHIRQLGHSIPGSPSLPMPLPVQQQRIQSLPIQGVQQPVQYPSSYSGHSFPLTGDQTPYQNGPMLAPATTPGMIPNQYPPLMPPQLDANPHWSALLQDFDPTIDNPNVIRIPIRLAEGEQPNINEEMIKLEDGDIVFIESRETDVIYTGGLLGGGQYTLPREYDLGILEAISIAEGRSLGSGGSRSIGGVSALNRDVSVSASRVIILRTLPTGQRITVEVNLHKAMKYQEENILVQPGDMIILEYTALEAIAAITQRYLLEGALFGLAAAQLNTSK